jgi:hypothetical protein
MTTVDNAPQRGYSATKDPTDELMAGVGRLMRRG